MIHALNLLAQKLHKMFSAHVILYLIEKANKYLIYSFTNT